MARVFISHSSRDADPAARIKTWLQGQGFETPFLDFDKHVGIPPGADWEKTLYREIERSEAIIIIQTPNWMDSKWCFAEYTQARALGKAIFPVIETPTGDTLIAPDMQAINLLRDREGGMEQLSKELTRIALDVQGGFPWDSRRPPYPGLSAFQEEDAALYFGRDDDIRRLIERLNARRAQGGAKLIALLGASGSGKSSLLRAGVIPRIKRDRRNWIVLPPMRPQSHPVDELARAVAIALEQGADWRSWRDQLNGADLARTLNDLASDLRMQTGANEAHILIPVDQGEELFGASDPAEADRFFEILTAAMSEDLPFLAVLAQRSDFLEKLQSADKLTVRFEEFSLGPLPPTGIPQVIEGPARVAGLGIDDGLVLQASKDAETEDALPLLAFALRELFDRYGGDNHLSLENYYALGDAKANLTPLENAVRKAADDVLTDSKPGAEELTALREAFVPAMVRVNDKGEYVRRPAQWDYLPAKAHPLLERLVKARLLVISQESDGRVVEVAHEALLRKWPRLRDWLDEEREFLTGKQQLERDLHDWACATETDKTGALLSGLKLNRARGWLLERPHQLTAQERAFVQASTDQAEAEEQGKTRTRRRILQGSIAASVVLAAMAGFAFVKGQQANESAREAEEQYSHVLARNLETTSRSADEELGALLAIESLVAKPTSEGLSALKQRMARLLRPPAKTLPVAEGAQLGTLAVDTSGRWLAMTTTYRDGLKTPHEAITLHDLKDGTEKELFVRSDLESRDRIKTLRISSNGRWLVGASLTSAIVWDTSTGEVLARIWSTEEASDVDANSGVTPLNPNLRELNFEFDSIVSFSHDNSKLYVANGGDMVYVYATSTWTVLGQLQPDQGPVLSVTADPNGKYVAIGAFDGASLWSAQSLQPLASYPSLRSGLLGLSISPDHKHIVAQRRPSGTAGVLVLQVSETEDGQITGLDPIAEWPHFTNGDGFRQAEFSSSGQYLYLRTSGGRFRSLDMRSAPNLGSGEDIRKTGTKWRDGSIVNELYGARVFTVANGQFIIGVKHGVGIWTDRGNRAEVRFIPGKYKSVSFSPDGRWFASLTEDGALRMYSGEDLSVWPNFSMPERVESFGFSPDSKWMVVGGANTLTLLETQTWEIAVPPIGFSGESKISAAFSRGSKLLIGSGGGETIVVHPQNGIVSQRITGTANYLSPDGTHMIAYSPEKVNRGGDIVSPMRIHMWDTETAKEIDAAPKAGEFFSEWQYFTPPALIRGDDLHLTKNHRWSAAIAHEKWPGSSGITVHALRVEDLISDACSRLSRNLKEKEWNEHLRSIEYQARCSNWRIR